MSHENLRGHVAIEHGSVRGFGWTMAIAFVLAALLLAWWGKSWAIWLWLPAVIFAALTVLAPRWLAPLNRAWFRFGILLGRLIDPLVMGVIFFLVVTPMALARRRYMRASLGLDFDPAASSYWKARIPPGPDPAGMPRQF